MRFKSKGSVDDQFEGHSKWQRQYGQWTLHRDPINQNAVNVFRNHFASDKVDSFIKVLLVALRGEVFEAPTFGHPLHYMGLKELNYFSQNLCCINLKKKCECQGQSSFH